MQLPELIDKKVLITGASSGIGAETAIQFAQQGAFVGVHYSKNQIGAQNTLKKVQDKSNGILLKADVRDPVQIDKMVNEFAKENGAIDVLVNNVGKMIERKTIEEADPEYYDEIFTINVRSAFLVSKAALPHLKLTNGNIINVGSVAGHSGGFQGSGIYATTKGALGIATIAMAKEFFPFGIRVNSVLPGFIDTPFHEGVTSSEIRDKIIEQTPLKRAGTTKDIAKAILFLSSESASFITGEYLAVNGGLHMRI